MRYSVDFMAQILQSKYLGQQKVVLLFFKKILESDAGLIKGPLFLQKFVKRDHDYYWGNDFCPRGTPMYGTHFSKNRPFSDHASNPQSGHARRMSCLHCDLSETLEQTRPPDPESVDLIEQAFIEGQIDSQKADLAYAYL